MPRKVSVAAGCDDLAQVGKLYCPDHERRRQHQQAERYLPTDVSFVRDV